jgi:hypothetical protein
MKELRHFILARLRKQGQFTALDEELAKQQETPPSPDAPRAPLAERTFAEPVSTAPPEYVAKYNEIRALYPAFYAAYRDANERSQRQPPEPNFENMTFREILQALPRYAYDQLSVSIGELFGGTVRTRAQKHVVPQTYGGNEEQFWDKEFPRADTIMRNLVQVLTTWQQPDDPLEVKNELGRLIDVEQGMTLVIEQHQKLVEFTNIVSQEVQGIVDSILAERQREIVFLDKVHNEATKKTKNEFIYLIRNYFKLQKHQSAERANEKSNTRFMEAMDEMIYAGFHHVVKMMKYRFPESVGDNYSSHVRELILSEAKRQLLAYLDGVAGSRATIDQLSEYLAPVCNVKDLIPLFKNDRRWDSDKGPLDPQKVSLAIIDEFAAEAKHIRNVNGYELSRTIRLEKFLKEASATLKNDDIQSDEEILELIKSKIFPALKPFLRETVLRSFTLFTSVSNTEVYQRLFMATGSFDYKAVIPAMLTTYSEYPSKIIRQFTTYLLSGNKISNIVELTGLLPEKNNNAGREVSSFKFMLSLLLAAGRLNIDNVIKYWEDGELINNTYSTYTALESNLPPHLRNNAIKYLLIALKDFSNIEGNTENLRVLISILHNLSENISDDLIVDMIRNVNFSNLANSDMTKKLVSTIASLCELGGGQGSQNVEQINSTNLPVITIANIKASKGEIIEFLIDRKMISASFYDDAKKLLDFFFISKQRMHGLNENAKALMPTLLSVNTACKIIGESEMIVEYTNTAQPKNPNLFKLNLQINDKLRFRVLDAADPQHFQAGVETDCCQRPGGQAESCAVDSFINTDASTLLLEWQDREGKWVIVSQSYFHYIPKDKSFILDNIESNWHRVNEAGLDLETIYAWYAHQLKAKLGLKYFVSGAGYSKLEKDKFGTKKLPGDPRTYHPKSIENYSNIYSDFDPDESIDLLKPKFKLNKLDPNSWGQNLSREAIESEIVFRKLALLILGNFEPHLHG